MIRVKCNSDFSKTKKYLNKLYYIIHTTRWDSYAREGVEALRANTPVDSGKTRESWDYRIVKQKDGALAIEWINTNINNYVNIAIILQYGHGTRNGGYVAGRDYINPALQPIFDELAESAWKEVTET